MRTLEENDKSTTVFSWVEFNFILIELLFLKKRIKLNQLSLLYILNLSGTKKASIYSDTLYNLTSESNRSFSITSSQIECAKNC